MNFEECIKLVKEFVEEKLDGNLLKLKCFDLLQLKGDKKYGCTVNFDCDVTNIMRAIYVVVWGDILPELTYENIGTGKMYRGDTMNSFASLFGKPVTAENKTFTGSEKFEVDEILKAKIRDYYKRYHTAGNMVVLPNMSLNGTTINLYRGKNRWHDYFDIFLLELRKCLIGTKDCDRTLINLIEKNSFYFDKFKGDYGFHKICQVNFFNPYLESDEGDVKELFSPHLYHYQSKNGKTMPSNTFYAKFANNYIDVSLEIMEYRSAKIIEKLQEKIMKNPLFDI